MITLQYLSKFVLRCMRHAATIVASAGVGSSALAATPTARITALSSSGMEPFTVHVHALQSTLGGGDVTTSRFEWDFGDPTRAYNLLEGFNAAHTYDSPGTYVITLRVTNLQNEFAEEQLTIQVQPNTRSSRYVAANGSDENAGTTPSMPFRTLSRALSDLPSNTKVQLRKGDVFDVSSSLGIHASNIVLNSYGDGPLPVIRWTGPRTSAPMLHVGGSTYRDITIRALRFDSVHNATTVRETIDAIAPRGTNITIRNCTFGQVSMVLNCNQNPVGVLAQGNTAGIIGAYFSWAQGSDHVYLDNRVGGSSFEHNIRLAGTSRVLISHNKLTAQNKSCVWSMTGNYSYIVANEATGGPISVGPNPAEGGNQSSRWAVVERNIISKTGEPGVVRVLPGGQGVNIRNNVITGNATACIDIMGSDRNTGRVTKQVAVLNNTGRNLFSSGKFLYVGAGAEQMRLENNIYVAPSLVTGSYLTANVFMLGSNLSQFEAVRGNIWAIPASFQWVPDGHHYLWPYWSHASGYLNVSQWNSLSPVHNEAFDRLTLSSSFAPAVGSMADIHSEPAVGVHTDLLGRRRPTGIRWTAGAIELNPADDGLPPPPPPPPPTPESGILFLDTCTINWGWTSSGQNLISGHWERVVPSGDGRRGDPIADFDGGTACYVTQNGAGNTDVDGGPAILTSLRFALQDQKPYVFGFAVSVSTRLGTPDVLHVEVSNNDGLTWKQVMTIGHTNGWEWREYLISEHVALTNHMRFRFSIADDPNDSVTEAALDYFRISYGPNVPPPPAAPPIPPPPPTAFVNFSDHFESDTGWTATSTAGTTSGYWQRGMPAGIGEWGEPVSAYGGSGQCYLTGNSAGESDVDGGTVELVSPVFDATTNAVPRISYACWFSCIPADPDDSLRVYISNNEGESWTLVEDIRQPTLGWQLRGFHVEDFVSATTSMQLKFAATDGGVDSITEAAIDVVSVEFGAIPQPPPPPPPPGEFLDNFETNTGWTVVNSNLSGGAWERGTPAGNGLRGDPTSDADGSGRCYLTGNAPGDSDVDGGPTTLISPRLDMTLGPHPMIKYYIWMYNDDMDADAVTVELSNDDGQTWTTLEVIYGGVIGWQQRVHAVSSVLTPTASMRVRYSVSDNPNDSITEAGLDGFHLYYSAGPSGINHPFVDTMETELGWTVINEQLTDGAWQRGVPIDDGVDGDPLADFDGSGQCYLTGNRLYNSDVDGGPTILISPRLNLQQFHNPFVSAAIWISCNNQDDSMEIAVSNNGGNSWVPVAIVTHTNGWEVIGFHVKHYVTLTNHVLVRFSVSDNPNNSITEAAVDRFELSDTGIGPGPIDLMSSMTSGSAGATWALVSDPPARDPDPQAEALTAMQPGMPVSQGDESALPLVIAWTLQQWGPCELGTWCSADLNGDGVVDVFDLSLAITSAD